jgi:hypothetical protein
MIRGARLHGLNRHRHVAVARDQDRRQPMACVSEPQQSNAVDSRQAGIDQQASSRLSSLDQG